MNVLISPDPKITRSLKVGQVVAILIFSVGCLWALAGQAQVPTIENYSIASGLPSAEVYDVYQDKNGFLWFCTDSGVAKFDGETFEIYNVKQGLSDPVVFSIYEDGKGRLWFRSYSGRLSYYHEGKIFQYAHNDTLIRYVKSMMIHSFHVDKDETLWVGGSKKGVVIIDRHGAVREEEVPRHSLYYKSLDGDQGIVASSSSAPLKLFFNGRSFDISLTSRRMQNQVVQCIRWNGQFLFSYNDDIFSLYENKVKKIFTGPAAIINMAKDDQGNLWVGYLNKGVACYTPQFEKKYDLSFLNNKSVTKTLQDHEGGYWFTTLESGTYYVPNIDIQNIALPVETKIKSVLSVNNNIFIGDQQGVLNVFNEQKKKLWTHTFNAPILTVFQDSRKNVWLSSAFEVHVLDSLFKNQNIAKQSRVDFAEDWKGNVWGIGGGGYLAQFDSIGNLRFQYSEDIYRSVLTHQSLLFLAGRTGLQVRTLNDRRTISTFPGLMNYKITDLMTLNDTTIICATTGNGFILLNTKTLQYRQYDNDHEFLANAVYSLHKADSLLWLGTEKGLFVTSLPALLRGDVSFNSLSRKSGINSDKVNFITSTKNMLWAFGDNGVSVIPKNKLKFANREPLFYLKEFLINKHHVDAVQHKNLSHDQNDLYLSYGFISFNNNSNIRTRFRLSSSEPWIYTSNRYLEFYSMAPGTYNLNLEFTIDNKHWYSGIADMQFTINSPWWKTWYYQLAFLIVLLFLTFVYFKNNLALIRQKQKFLEIVNQHQQKLLQTEIQTTERERSRIAKDLHDTVGTNLVAIKMMVGQILVKHNEPLADQVESQLHSVIEETKEIIYNLTPPGIERYGLFILLKNQVDKLNRATTTPIHLMTYGNDLYNKVLNLLILRIIQELISNSLKHARASNIHIYINTFEDRINIIYEDDGIGFSYGDNGNRGFGLHNIESRIESVKGQIKFESGEFGISYNIDIPFAKNERSSA